MAGRKRREIERLRLVLVEIAEHWGEPIPLDTPCKVVARRWVRECHAVQNIARRALGMAEIGP